MQWPQIYKFSAKVILIGCNLHKSRIILFQSYRKLLNVSTELQDIYTTTQICLPKSLIPNACKEADKLLNFTFIQIKNELKQIKFDGNSYGEITPVQHLPLICFRGEPDLENLMSDGKNFTC